MSRFDRYMLSQLMMLFGFFSLVLVAVYWVNRAVLLFNALIGDGQSMGIFLEFTALTLPNVIKIMLPVSAFAASVYVTNRLSTESELVVMQAVGLSSFRLARPVVMFGLVVAVLVSLLAHVLVPASRVILADRTVAMAQNVTTKFLTEGKFMHPTDGVTLFIRQITPLGEMHGIFLSDGRDGKNRTTYTAQRALLVKVETGTKLVMFDGMVQRLSIADNQLSVTRFADFSYDIGGLIAPLGTRKQDVAELGTWELLHPTPTALATTNADRAAFLYEANVRFASALNAMVASVVGFATLLLGGFSRFGNWRQILIGVGMLIGLQLMIDWTAGFAVADARLWPMVYLPSLVGGAVTLALLWWSEQPARRPALRGEYAS